MIKLIKIHSYEVGLYFRNGEFRGLLDAGWYVLMDVPFYRAHVYVVSQCAPWIVHEKLDVIVKSGALNGRAKVLDLKDYERALVWIDGRFSHVLPPGLSAYWTTFCDVKAEIVDAREVRITHADLPVIVKSQLAERVLQSLAVPAGQVGVWFKDGDYAETLPAGRYAFWKDIAEVKLVPIETPDGAPAVGIMREDAVTIGINTRGLAYRPEYRDWQLRIVIEFNPRLVSEEQLLALIDQAGWGVGICEGRPERSSALGWGRFERV